MQQKRTRGILSLAIIITIIALAACGTQGPVYPYPFETAKIEYTHSGNVEGTTTVYYKNDRSAHQNNVVDQNGQEVNSLLLNLGEDFYEIDQTAGIGVIAESPIYSELKSVPPQERLELLTRIGIGIDNNKELPEPKETRTIAGQECKLYTVADVGEICLWNGIPLYSTINLPEAGINNTTVATSIQTNIEVSESIFEVPTDIEFNDIRTQQTEVGN